MQTPTSIGDTMFYTIKAYDIDSHKRAMPVALIRAMHEAAMQNVIRLGISVWDLEPQQLAWVLSNKYVQFERLPILGERLQIVTQPAGFEKVFTYRDYLAYDEKGELVFYAASTWLLMNTTTRRMMRIPESIRHFEKEVPPIEDCLDRSRIDFKAFDRGHFEAKFRVDWHDLDFNQHANNVNYIRWMLEVLGSVLSDWQLKKLEIQFKAECHWGDELIASAMHLGNKIYLHQLNKVKDGKLLAIARTSWEGE
ncbi:MAG: acyl-ACP thioesterase domain-containing protein [Bacteroidota bacterium]